MSQIPKKWAFFFMYEGALTGGPKRTFDTAEAGHCHGISPVLVCNQDNPLLEKAGAQGWKVHLLDIPKSLWQRQGKAITMNPVSVLGLLKDLRSVASQIESLIVKEKISGWWSRGVKNVLMAKGATRRTNIPLVWDIGAEYKSKGLVQGIHWLGFRASTKVVAQASHVFQTTFPPWMLKKYKHKIVPIIPGLTSERAQHLRPLVDVYDRTKPISIIGTINARKNQKLLIDTCNQMMANRKFQVQIVGSPTDDEYYQQCLAAARKNSSSYHWLGWSDDIYSVLENSSAVIICSKQEGVPQVALEAMYSGRPVISVPVGGVPDLIKNGESGFLAKSTTKDDLSVAIDSFIDADDLMLERIRRAAFDAAYDLANHENWQRSYAELLKDIAN